MQRVKSDTVIVMVAEYLQVSCVMCVGGWHVAKSKIQLELFNLKLFSSTLIHEFSGSAFCFNWHANWVTLECQLPKQILKLSNEFVACE